MFLTRFVPVMALSLFLSVSTSVFAGSEEQQEEFNELKQAYDAAVAQSGKMSEPANEVREEIIDHFFDFKLWVDAVPYLRDTWAWYEQEGIRGKRKGRIRFRLGKALRIAGYFEEADPLLEKACNNIVEKKGEGHKASIKRCIDYGSNLSNLGRHDEAIPLLEKNLGLSESVFGENHGKTAWATMKLGEVYHRAGQYKKAKKHLKQAYEMFLSKKGSGGRLTNVARIKLGKLFRVTGELDKSERILRKGYIEFASKKKNQTHHLSLHLMTLLGRTLQAQGRYAEAEALLKEGIEKKKKYIGETSHKTFTTMMTLAQIYLDQNKYQQAEAVLLDIAKADADNSLQDISRIGARRNILWGRTMLQSGKLKEAEVAYNKVKAYLDSTNEVTGKTKAYYSGIGRTYFRMGDYARAEPYLLEAAKLSEQLKGKYDPKTSMSKRHLAENYVGQKRFDKAVEIYREVMESNAGFLAKRETFSSSGRAQQEAATQRHLFSYMKLMVNAHQKGIKIDAEPVSESFAIAESSRSKSLQTAMLGQTARAAARNEYLSELVRREQDVRVRLGVLEEELLEFVKAASKGDGKQGKRLEEERRELIDELKKIGEEMSYQYPEYNRLVNPTATSLQEVQKLLAPGELMLAYFTQKDRTLIWAIDSGKASLHVSKLAEKDIHARVQRLRAGLDVPIATLNDIPAYNTKIAHELYKELVAPAGKQLSAAKSLIIVPHRALLSMPFGALVTSASKPKKGALPFEEYKSVPWLARKYAMSIVPSATALVTMRTYAKREPAEQPFIGFGDPIFSDREDTHENDLVGRGVKVAQRAVINTRSIQGLPNLPETRQELQKIALSLGASEENLYLGKNASEVNVKGADLKNYKVVAFATHGLVAGDLDGLEQPALALTPPDKGTEENDGLLQMGEVLGLELNADWVVLSACNTASGDKSLANEGLTGLTQAFFYAGSRALLVSLWPVESTSTQELTTSMFAAAKQDSNLGRAASLQAARKRLIEGQGYMHEGKEVFSYAHPIFWSAFIAVGEGGVN